jgi:hypothetical protein
VASSSDTLVGRSAMHGVSLVIAANERRAVIGPETLTLSVC